MSNEFSDLLHRHRLSLPISWVLTLMMTGILIWIVTQLLWLVLRWNQPLPEPLALAGMDNLSTPPPSSLSKWHLFGNSVPLADNRALAMARESDLQLKLLLVWAASDPKQGYAIIADANGVEHSLRVGKEIVPGVILDQVFPDRVVLARNGVLEILSLPRNNFAPVKTVTTPLSSAGKSSFVTSNGVTAATGNISSQLPLGAIGAPNLPMQGVDLEAVRKKLGVDPVELAQNISALPVMESGKMVGVRLSAGAQSAVLAKLGLQPDDVVTAVNGVDVTDPARISGMIASLPQTRQINVVVRRNGKSETLAVDLN